MATRGRPLDQYTRTRVEKRIHSGVSIYRIARDVGVSEPTVRKIRKQLLTNLGKVDQ